MSKLEKRLFFRQQDRIQYWMRDLTDASQGIDEHARYYDCSYTRLLDNNLYIFYTKHKPDFTFNSILFHQLA
jgi:hypothetical protein